MMDCEIELMYADYLWECEDAGVKPKYDNWQDWWNNME